MKSSYKYKKGDQVLYKDKNTRLEWPAVVKKQHRPHPDAYQIHIDINPKTVQSIVSGNDLKPRKEK